MKITWDDEGRKGVIVPDCCKEVQQSGAVWLGYLWSDLSDEDAIYAKVPEGLSRMRKYVDGKPLPSEVDKWIEANGGLTGKTCFEEAVPVWKMGSGLSTHSYRMLREVQGCPRYQEIIPKVCPFCGTPLPEIERIPDDELTVPVHTPAADGGYCETCKERSQCCTCSPPEFRWRTVR
jgi:hypothetical protein